MTTTREPPHEPLDTVSDDRLDDVQAVIGALTDPVMRPFLDALDNQADDR
jgi:hypothetical protein